ncbi:acyltransferase domain-containing protein [Streptomyces sp. NPDC047130]|uniref:acyltransferase domain-containing protein n=1 Tax=Streptomyces sp. NPDC047130 TaxID=3155261 RepID=UPI0033F7A3C0
MTSRIAFVFPGQGAYVPGLLAGFPEKYPEVARILREVDEVSAGHGHRRVSDVLLDPAAPRLDELLEQSPETLHLCIFALSLAGAAVCAAEGVHADVLVGHSFGEWAALTLAGVWTPSEAARLICERDRICRRAVRRPGGLLAVALDRRRARHLAAVVDDWAVNVAVVNGPGQSVLSGPHEALDAALRVARALDVQAVRVKAAYPYHSPWMRGAADEFGPLVHRAETRAPGRRVYSPIAGGYVGTKEDVAVVGADHMVRPVDFRRALHDLEEDGVDVFVECGGKDIVTRLVLHALPGVTTAAPLARRTGPGGVREALAPVLVATGTAPDRSPEKGGAGRAAPVQEVGGRLESTHTAPVAVLPSETSDEARGSGPVRAGEAPPPPGGTPEAEAESGTGPQSVEGPHDADPSPAAAVDQGAGELPRRADVIETLRSEYAERLGYPPEVVTADADLEADLGVDSLRQTEMLTSLYTRYGIQPPEEADPQRGRTLADVADLLLELGGRTEGRTA